MGIILPLGFQCQRTAEPWANHSTPAGALPAQSRPGKVISSPPGVFSRRGRTEHCSLGGVGSHAGLCGELVTGDALLLMRCRRGCRHPPPASPRALALQPPRQLLLGIGAAANRPSAPPWLGTTAQQLARGTRHLKGRCSQRGAWGVQRAGWSGWHRVLAAPEPSRLLTPLHTQRIGACQRGAGRVPVESRPPSLPPQEKAVLWFQQGKEGGGTSSPLKGTARSGTCKLTSSGDAEGLALSTCWPGFSSRAIHPEKTLGSRAGSPGQQGIHTAAATGSLSQDSSTSSHPLSPCPEQQEPPGQAPTTMVQEREQM